MYTKNSPSPRFLELIEQYQIMHEKNQHHANNLDEDTQGFPGLSLFPHAQKIKRIIDLHQAHSVLDYGSGKGIQYQIEYQYAGTTYPTIKDYWQVDKIECYDPGLEMFADLAGKQSDLLISTDVMEHCPEEDLDWVIREMCDHAHKALYVHIACSLAKKNLPNGENAHCTVESPFWWHKTFQAVIKDYPHLRVYYDFGIKKNLTYKLQRKLLQWTKKG